MGEREDARIRQLEYIIHRAKLDPRKGSYPTYNYYKQELTEYCDSCYEFEEYTKKLAEALKV